MTVTAPVIATEMAVEGSDSHTLTTAEESGRKTAAERLSKDRVPGGESRHGFGMSLHEESPGTNRKTRVREMEGGDVNCLEGEGSNPFLIANRSSLLLLECSAVIPAPTKLPRAWSRLRLLRELCRPSLRADGGEQGLQRRWGSRTGMPFGGSRHAMACCFRNAISTPFCPRALPPVMSAPLHIRVPSLSTTDNISPSSPCHRT